MKRKAYSISSKANTDLEEIWLYTFQNWSAEQADRYYDLIIEEIEFLCENIHSGKSMNHVRAGYRASKVKSHLIFYRLVNDQLIEVIRILHESMDLPSQLGD